MKYDGAQTDRDNPTTRRLRELAGFADDDIVLLAGSTQEPEEEAALEVYRRLEPGVAPAAAGARAASSRAVCVGRPAAGRLGHCLAAADRVGPVRAPSDGPRVVGRRGGRAGGLVGTGPDRVRRRQPGQPRRPEHDRAGRLWSGGLLRAQYAELPRHRGRHAARDAAVVVADAEGLAQFVGRCLEDPAYAAALGQRAQHSSANNSGPRGGRSICWQLWPTDPSSDSDCDVPAKRRRATPPTAGVDSTEYAVAFHLGDAVSAGRGRHAPCRPPVVPRCDMPAKTVDRRGRNVLGLLG